MAWHDHIIEEPPTDNTATLTVPPVTNDWIHRIDLNVTAGERWIVKEALALFIAVKSLKPDPIWPGREEMAASILNRLGNDNLDPQPR